MTNSDFNFFSETLNPGVPGGARSTPNDYLKFLHMLARGGLNELGEIVLTSASIETFFTNQTYGLPEYNSPWRYSQTYPYNQRPDYSKGTWVIAQNPSSLVVEALASPGAFGTFPFVDRRRGLHGLFFCVVPYGEGHKPQGNALEALALLWAEVDPVGLPPPPPTRNPRLRTVGSHTVLEWGGTARLRVADALGGPWTELPWARSPCSEALPTPGAGTPSRFFQLVP